MSERDGGADGDGKIPWQPFRQPTRPCLAVMGGLEHGGLLRMRRTHLDDAAAVLLELKVNRRLPGRFLGCDGAHQACHCDRCVQRPQQERRRFR